MNTIKTLLAGTTVAALGFSTAAAQNIVTGTSNVVKGAVAGTTNVAKGAAGSAISGVKGLASMPGKALRFGDSSLPNLSAGTQEFGLGGNVQFGGDVIYNLDLSYGYFFKDNWEVGFDANLQGSDFSTTFGVGLFTEYNFDLDSKWVPFVGASIGLASINTDGDAAISDDVSGLSLGGVFGVKYFIRENIAISASVDFQWSPDDVFGGLEEAKSAASNINIGTRFYF